ncbi:MAG: serine hydrolase domain-containing protein [Pseudomonadota bacterium]
MRRVVRSLLIVVLLLLGLWVVEAPRSEEAALERVARLAENAVRDGHFPSLSVAWVAPGEVIWAESCGLADAADGRAMTPSTPMPIGSISKVLIGQAAAQEAVAGRFDLDAPLGTYWADAPPTVAQMTFRALATHTSGLRDTEAGYEEAAYHFGALTHPVALEDFLTAYLTPGGALYSGDVLPEPGAHGYSNVGAALAAHALSQATGTPFDELSLEALAPLGLAATWDAAILPDRATLHEDKDGFQALAPYALATWPDGGLNASLEDLAKLLAAFMGGGRLNGTEVLPAAAVALQRQKHATPTETLSEGLFWAHETIDLPGLSLAVEGHSGGDPGLITMMYRIAGSDRGFVLMVNGYRDSDWTLAQAARIFFNLKRAADLSAR